MAHRVAPTRVPRRPGHRDAVLLRRPRSCPRSRSIVGLIGIGIAISWYRRGIPGPDRDPGARAPRAVRPALRPRLLLRRGASPASSPGRAAASPSGSARSSTSASSTARSTAWPRWFAALPAACARCRRGLVRTYALWIVVGAVALLLYLRRLGRAVAVTDFPILQRHHRDPRARRARRPLPPRSASRDRAGRRLRRHGGDARARGLAPLELQDRARRLPVRRERALDRLARREVRRRCRRHQPLHGRAERAALRDRSPRVGQRSRSGSRRSRRGCSSSRRR